MALESESEPSPNTRHRFDLSGKSKRKGPSDHPKLSSDDILDSLTRHAASQAGFREEQTKSLELLAETEEPTLEFEPDLLDEHEPHLRTEPRRLGHYAFVLMCVGGMVIVWLYSSGKGMFDPSLLAGLVARTGIQSVFANPLQIGVVSIFALMAALWIALRRRASRLRLEL